MLSVLAKRQNNLTVVLENVFDPHNISAVLRSCDAVGIQEVYVLTTKAPPHQRWGFRSSSGAYKWITVHQYTDSDICIKALRESYDKVLTTSFTTDAVNLYELDLTQKLALVFGNEKDGVSEEIKTISDGHFIIPQVGMIKSLNISVACAVTLYEAYRQKQLAGDYEQTHLPEHQVQKLLNEWGCNDEN